VLRGVNFDFDKATIRPDAAEILAEAARILREDPDIYVSVDGHTDARGTDQYNERLSERRAQAVVEYLTRLDVSRSRLRAQGFGESRPVASNDTEEGRAQNRRVELNVIR
jgi:OOP family OmpA-OmpF porin